MAKKKQYLFLSRLGTNGFTDGKEQVFPERTAPVVHMPRFCIPAGTFLATRKLSERTWREHRTNRELGFERFEYYLDGVYQFRELGWLIQVHRRFVVHREDVLRRQRSCATVGPT